MHFRFRVLALACVLALLTSCADGNRVIAPTPLADSMGQASIAASTQTSAFNPDRRHRHKGRLTVRIRIPKQRHHRLGARYISAATKGMTMAFTGPSSFTDAVDLTPSDPRCSGSPLTCTIEVALAAGSYTVTVNTYDQAPVSDAIPAGAKVLSTASSVPLSVKIGIANTFGVTLEGVPASVAVSGLPSATAGTAFGAPKSFTVTAKDADGDTIVGTYTTPVTLTDSDTSGATAITTAGTDSPPAGKLLSSTDASTLSYTGLAIAPATIAATASKATAGRASFTPTLAPIVYSGPTSASLPAINLYAGSSATTSATFSASEVGWTNAPYNKSISLTAPSGCAGFSTSGPSGGNAFSTALIGSPSRGSCALALTDFPGGQTLNVAVSYAPSTQEFFYTGSAQYFTPPNGVSRVTITAAGAQGGASSTGVAGGEGGSVTATFQLDAALMVDVGSAGSVASDVLSGGGYNGGGGSGTQGLIGSSGGGGGGGFSDVLAGAGTYLILGGGGGGAGASNNGNAGAAGGNGGQVGAAGSGASMGGGGGAGATQSAGGAVGGGNCPGGAGSALQGGSCGDGYGSGGGGGGYYGGGAGGLYIQGPQSGYGGGGGGGGSSFADASAIAGPFYTSGTRTGDGYVLITW